MPSVHSVTEETMAVLIKAAKKGPATEWEMRAALVEHDADTLHEAAEANFGMSCSRRMRSGVRIG